MILRGTNLLNRITETTVSLIKVLIQGLRHLISNRSCWGMCILLLDCTGLFDALSNNLSLVRSVPPKVMLILRSLHIISTVHWTFWYYRSFKTVRRTRHFHICFICVCSDNFHSLRVSLLSQNTFCNIISTIDRTNKRFLDIITSHLIR